MKKCLLLGINIITNFLQFRMKYVIKGGGYLFDYDTYCYYFIKPMLE